MEPFTLLHYYSDGSGKPEVIYLGTDKAAAFDALLLFLRKHPAAGCINVRMLTPADANPEGLG